MKKLLLSFILIFSIITCVYADEFDESIDFLISKNVISSYPDGNFYPDKLITRSEFLKMAVKSLNRNIGFFGTSFSDVKNDSWYYPYVSFAEKEGIISGTDGKFMPESLITRQDAAVILARAYNTDNTRSFNISQYTDGIYISEYALGAMAYMSGEKIMCGDGENIRPTDYLTRKEASLIIYRMMKNNETESEEIQTDFCEGYPKMREGGISGGFNLTIKTTSECNVYYALSGREYSVFDRIIPDNFLVSMTDKDGEVNVYIPAENNKEYTIYFCTVDKYGERGNIVNIKNAVANPYPKGYGTEENPYIITTENQLYSMRYFPDKCYKLNNDIVLSESWEPIGTDKTPFTGKFDGGGFMIDNLNVENKETGGLFGIIKNGEIKNLNVSANMVSSAERAGIIAGEINGGLIENCLVDGLVESKGRSGGGIVGVNGGNIKNCQSLATAIKAQNYAGGIAGKNTGIIDSCMSASYLVQASMYASGVAGINEGGVISDCAGLSMNIVDEMASNSGRITTNRRGGKLENNYSYDLAYAHNNQDNGKNSINGEYTSLKDFSSLDFYENKLNWNTDKYWKEGDKEFIIPLLKIFEKPDIEKGLTVYAPVLIYTKEDFLNISNDVSANYALMNDIELGSIRPLCESEENGFCGSINGNGHRLYNIQLDYDEKTQIYGLFGYITGGFVRDLRLEDMYVSGNDITGGFAGVNYANLANIDMQNITIRADQVEGENVTSGALAAVNYGTIKDCDVKGTVNIRGENMTVGMISGYNEGVITNSLSIGKINASGYENSSITAGGICGFNNSLLSGLFSDTDINAKAKTSYLGGIAGMSDGGEIYKASSCGNLNSSKTNSCVYAGGIFALGSEIKLSNCHSHDKITIKAEEVYSGGIGGYNVKSNIQNSYTTAKLNISGKSGYIGGIVGVNENGFINSNVSFAEFITNNQTGNIAAKSSEEGISNNYTIKTDKGDNYLNGKGMDLKDLQNGKFYFDSVMSGGKLGWSNIYSSTDGIWKWGSEIVPSYKYPLLEGVPGQEYFTQIQSDYR